MSQVNMHDAKTRLSKLVHDLESGREDEITIARNGTPVARLVRADDRTGMGNRIGVAKGAFRLPEQTEELDR
ncbi:MAG: type II toxin-antitoxin system Phd/YefM family antitoxin, partial [Spirochaetota bacterium]